MSTINILLPDSLREFVDQQVAQRGYGRSGEYVRELIRKDQGRLSLRSLLLDGAVSKPAVAATSEYFQSLRREAGKCAAAFRSRQEWL